MWEQALQESEILDGVSSITFGGKTYRCHTSPRSEEFVNEMGSKLEKVDLKAILRKSEAPTSTVDNNESPTADSEEVTVDLHTSPPQRGKLCIVDRRRYRIVKVAHTAVAWVLYLGSATAAGSK